MYSRTPQYREGVLDSKQDFESPIFQQSSWGRTRLLSFDLQIIFFLIKEKIWMFYFMMRRENWDSFRQQEERIFGRKGDIQLWTKYLEGVREYRGYENTSFMVCKNNYNKLMQSWIIDIYEYFKSWNVVVESLSNEWVLQYKGILSLKARLERFSLLCLNFRHLLTPVNK